MKQTFVLLLSLFYMSSMVGQVAPDIMDLKISYNETTVPPQYEVYMRSDNDADSIALGSCQVTVVVPASAPDNLIDNADIVTVYAGNWFINQTTFAPMANDSFDYYAVATAGGGDVNTDALTAGVEVLLFTFTIDGDCIEGIRLFDNMRDPLSSSMDGGLDFENNIALQFRMNGMGGFIETYDYLYGDLEPDCLIPVEFISFDANKGDGAVELTWVTATEINNAYFDVQRSVDGKEFRTIGRVEGQGTTFSTSNYTFMDKAPVESNYYRLRQVDLDGSKEFTDIKFVAFEQEESEESKFDIYPNPFVNELTLDLGGIDLYQVQMFDSKGQAVIQQSYISGSALDLTDLPSGSYTIKVYDALENEILVKTVVKTSRS